jgi:charged multivesicular body protein 6
MGSTASRNNVSSHDKAVLDLKIQRDRLKKYQKQIQVVLERETEVAKQLLKEGDKKRALLVLRRKKYQSQMLEKTEQQLMNLEEMCGSLEYAAVELQVLEGLKQGNEVLKQLNDQMKMEDVEKLMEETADALAYQQVPLFFITDLYSWFKEIGYMLSSKMTPDMDELAEAELEAMITAEKVLDCKFSYILCARIMNYLLFHKQNYHQKLQK